MGLSNRRPTRLRDRFVGIEAREPTRTVSTTGRRYVLTYTVDGVAWRTDVTDVDVETSAITHAWLQALWPGQVVAVVSCVAAGDGDSSRGEAV